MDIFINLDNTLCETLENDYEKSKPLSERINKINQMKKEGNKITIWSDRNSKTKKDYYILTKNQLELWGVQYDNLLMEKPTYDLYIDDKSKNVDSFWKIPKDSKKSKKISSTIVEKGWGREIIFVNNEEYCGKILQFNKGKKFSMHYHILKKETWYISKGSFILSWIDYKDGKTYSEYLKVGDTITNERGEAHQLEALEDSDLFEVSTHHEDCDSYRIYKGD